MNNINVRTFAPLPYDFMTIKTINQNELVFYQPISFISNIYNYTYRCNKTKMYILDHIYPIIYVGNKINVSNKLKYPIINDNKDLNAINKFPVYINNLLKDQDTQNYFAEFKPYTICYISKKGLYKTISIYN